MATVSTAALIQRNAADARVCERRASANLAIQIRSPGNAWYPARHRGKPRFITLTWIKVLRRIPRRSGCLQRSEAKMIRNILVPLTTELPSEALLDAALSVAKRLDGHIRAMFVSPNPDTAFAYLPEVILAAGVTRQVIERETQEAVVAAKDRFIDWRSRNNLPESAGGRSIAALRAGRSS